MKNKKILVVMGWTSSEKEVSIRSGEAVYNSLIKMNYNASKFILDEKNAFQIVDEKPDLCVLMLHGKNGEDGTIQGMLEIMNIPYTGSGVASSAICMNKAFTKKILSYENIPTPDYATFKKGDSISEFTKKVLSHFSFPLVTKAPCQGSSVGVEIVHNEKELIDSINKNIDLDNEILVEQFIKGKELTIPVMKNTEGEIEALPIIEITSENTFYDYESKYTSGMSKHIIPANISESAAKKVECYAIKTYKALNCNGVARIDFFVDENENPYVIEVNTIPGMTETSLVPDAARAAQISFEELVEKIVIQALNNN